MSHEFSDLRRGIAHLLFGDLLRKKRKTIIWTAAAGALTALLCGLFLYSRSFLPTGTRTPVNVSSTEVLVIFGRRALEFHGPARLSLGQAIKDPAYLMMRGRLLLGAKLNPLVTTNAALSELAVAFAFYSDCSGVIVLGEPDLVFVSRFEKFDSGHWHTRWRAAAAIRQLLGDAGWRVQRLTDGKFAFLSQGDYELLLAAKSSALQEGLLQKFNEAKDRSNRVSSAQILSCLWRAGFLYEQIKEQLVEKHYRLALRQLPSNGSPSWEVRTEQSFPFPDVLTEFTPTLYRNNQIKWSPGRPQFRCAMNVAGNQATSDPITSMSGGEFKNGDVLQCKIELAQKVDGRLWRTTLWTDKIILQGLIH